MTGSLVWDELLIGGSWATPADEAIFEVICLSTEQTVGRVPAGTAADMDRAVAAARAAFESGEWSSRPPLAWAEALVKLSGAVSDRADEVARVITTEMGAPLD